MKFKKILKLFTLVNGNFKHFLQINWDKIMSF